MESSIFQYAYLIQHEEMVPKTYIEAMRSIHHVEWQKAIDAEIQSLLKLNTWIVVDKPLYKKCLTGAFIFKKKYVGNGSIKYKARLIIHGFRQRYGEDYWETYAPVTSNRAIKALLAIAASNGMMIHQMDIDTAFLNAPLDEDIYMLPPEGLDIPEGKVLLLKKSLYGLKQSPRNFNKTLNKTIVNMGFKRCMSDTCMYTNNINGNDVYIAIYVDDIIIACVDEATIIGIKQQISKKIHH
jgi:hypothetical protein